MISPVVGIVDYGAGNIRSVTNALEHCGAATRRIRTQDDLSDCTHLVLPGVGAFGYCAERLRGSGLIPTIEKWALMDRKPLLGICVGMQLLADFSEEGGRHAGLGWIGGTVMEIPKTVPGMRVPHVGWDQVTFTQPFGDFPGDTSADFYFDHSFAYHAPERGETLAWCDHATRFSAGVRRENIVAVQFHPEKSQRLGLRFLRTFISLGPAG